MKKVLSIGFILIYVILTAGFQILLHTCDGETTVAVMHGTADDPCGCSDMPEQDRCCTMQVVSLHLDAPQQAVTVTLPGPDGSFALVPPGDRMLIADQAGPRAPRVVDTSPPGFLPFTILHCTFLI